MVKNLPANAGGAVGLGSIPAWKIFPGSSQGRSPGEGNGNPPPVFLPGLPNGQKSLVGYSPWGWKRVGHN